MKLNIEKFRREYTKQSMNDYAKKIESLTSDQVKFLMSGGTIDIPHMETFSISKEILDIEE